MYVSAAYMSQKSFISHFIVPNIVFLITLSV